MIEQFQLAEIFILIPLHISIEFFLTNFSQILMGMRFAVLTDKIREHPFDLG